MEEVPFVPGGYAVVPLPRRIRVGKDTEGGRLMVC
jgi:hypothetical protein